MHSLNKDFVYVVQGYLKLMFKCLRYFSVYNTQIGATHSVCFITKWNSLDTFLVLQQPLVSNVIFLVKT